MIKTLRLKFILVAMLSVTLVLCGIVAAINIGSYVEITEDADKVIELLMINGGTFPRDFLGEPFTKPDERNGMSPETPFETRFFSVKLDESGEPVFSDVKNIAAISAQTAEEYAKTLFAKGKSVGFYGQYRFNAKTENGETLFVFVDCSRSLETFGNFLTMSVLISIFGLLLVLVLIIIFSKSALKPVEESYRKQKSFITNASHDIKTPLTIINADTEVVELESGESEWTKDIKKQIARLTALTEKLVFLSRMEESENALPTAQLDLSALTEETVLPYEALAKLKELEFLSDIEKNVTVCGNEEALRQAVALLMDNAVKYAKPRGKIEVTLKRLGKGCELKFFNEAENVEKGNREEIFERFYRSDKSRNSSSGGNGIGLSVVKAIVEAHKGKISAESRDGKSLEVRIVL